MVPSPCVELTVLERVAMTVLDLDVVAAILLTLAATLFPAAKLHADMRFVGGHACTDEADSGKSKDGETHVELRLANQRSVGSSREELTDLLKVVRWCTVVMFSQVEERTRRRPVLLSAQSSFPKAGQPWYHDVEIVACD